MVVEPQLESAEIHIAGRAVIDDPFAAVPSWLHDQLRAGARLGRAAMRPQPDEAPYRSEGKQIAPAATDEGGNLDVLPVGFDVHLGPVVVVVGVGEPLVIVRSECAVLLEAAQRDLRRPFREDVLFAAGQIFI